ncbi:MAG TPA: DinB family protein [Tepidiformaceae bacterium]
MSTSVMRDAFAHHTWATVRLIDACEGLEPELILRPIPGTYGSILTTLRHIVDSDSFELFVASGERVPFVKTDAMDLGELRALMEANDDGWAEILESNPDPLAIVREVDPDDGYTRDAPLGLRLAAAIHHGNDHRSQVCVALTALGIEPPATDPMDYGLYIGTVSEVYPSGADGSG